MKKDSKKNVIEMMHASSLGLVMVVCIFGCLLIGVYLDRKFETTTNVFTMLFLVIGLIAGFRNIYTFIKKLLEDEKRADREAQRARKLRNDARKTRSSSEKN